MSEEQSASKIEVRTRLYHSMRKSPPIADVRATSSGLEAEYGLKHGGSGVHLEETLRFPGCDRILYFRLPVEVRQADFLYFTSFDVCWRLVASQEIACVNAFSRKTDVRGQGVIFGRRIPSIGRRPPKRIFQAQCGLDPSEPTASMVSDVGSLSPLSAGSGHGLIPIPTNTG